MPELIEVETSKLSEHPDNPRIRRDDVVEMIVASLNGEYPKEHAIHVRPFGKGHQIVSGHHRYWGATAKKFKTMWAWVSDMTDDEAYMALATSNAQGEMDAIEYARHIFKGVPKEQGKRSGGGLKEYAKSLGKTHAWANGLWKAGEVISHFETQVSKLRGRAKHLETIHASDPAAWPVLCEKLVDKSWTVADTQAVVAKLSAFDISQEWRELFLPFDKVARRCLESEFSAQTVERLIRIVSDTLSMIDEAEVSAEHKLATSCDYRQWLTEGIDGYSWDNRKLLEKYQETKESLDDTANPCDSWHHGNWRDHIDSVPDGLSAIVTDPPYGMAFQSNRRDEKKKAIQNDSTPDDATAEVRDMLTAFYPKMAENSSLFMFCGWQTEPEIRDAIESCGFKIKSRIIWVKNNHGTGDLSGSFAPKHEAIIHAVKGSPVLFSRPCDVLNADKCDSERHPTEKPTDLLKVFIEASTVKGANVADPFGGVASTLVAAQELGRGFWGCELEQDYYEAGRNRLLGKDGDE